MWGAHLLAILVGLAASYCCATSVSFDGRSFFVDGQRKLFIAGSIHYPRAPRSEWPNILKSAKESGLDLIQTYVFWDIHEPQNNQWNFPSDPTSSYDLVAFIQEAAKQGLYVNLRISGYVCAEWNFGGLPGWLRETNSTLRTYDQIWMTELSEFFEKTISVVKEAGLLADAGGPIIMMQMENEYGNMENYYGEKGHQYVQWLSDYALQLDAGGAVWIMCQQGEGVGTAPAKEIINTCNGFYCDNWISQHANDFPNQPHMFTELWPGWFQNWGEPVPHRPAVDVAFSVARWFARGGSYVNYYMAFGGSTFGRSVGGPLIVTSYDYDVQINEYAMKAEPKFSLLLQLHNLLHEYEEVLLGQAPPPSTPLQGYRNCESHIYKNSNTNKCIAFWSNWDESTSCPFTLPNGQTLSVLPWSVTITTGTDCSTQAYSTKSNADIIRPNSKTYTPISDFKPKLVGSTQEAIPSSSSANDKVPVVTSPQPLEQLSVTHDATDYLWYSTIAPKAYEQATKVTLQFSSGTAGGGIFYVYINKSLAARVLGKAGINPINHVKSSVEETSKVSVDVVIPAGPSANVDILSISMGLQNYGPYLEKIQVGIVGDVLLDGMVMKNFTHSIGLVGETQRVQAGTVQDVMSSDCDGLCWHNVVFRTPSSVTPTSHIALDLASSMGKGAVWLNGNMLGRYWNITAQASAAQIACKTCGNDFVGGYNGDKCRSGCGEASQRYYKVPADWLHSAER